MSTVALRIGPADHGRPMTLEEFREAEEQPGYLYELARGVLEVSDIPSDAHGHIVDNLHEAISEYRRQHRGRIYRVAHGSDIQLVIPELDSDRHPDLAVVFRNPPLTNRGRERPRLVCEVVSPGKRARHRDYEEKSEEYLTLGIEEYWIIDPWERKVTGRIRQDGPEGPTWSERIFTGDEVIVSGLLPGFQLTVAQLWIHAEPEEDNGPGDGQ